MNTFKRNAIAARASEVSDLLGLAIDLLAEVPIVDSNGHRNRQMDQLDALLSVTLAQVSGLPDRIEALQ